MTFGWRRAEVIGTMANVMATWLAAFWLILIATIYSFEDREIYGGRMLVVSVISLVLSFGQMLVLQSSSV